MCGGVLSKIKLGLRREAILGVASGRGEMRMKSDNLGAGRKTCPVSFLLLMNSIDPDRIVCPFENNSFALKTCLFLPL